MTHIDTTLAGFAALAASLVGSKAMPAAAALIATTTGEDMPSWATLMMGPFGGFIGLVLGLVWMARRLNAAEAKADKREAERDADRKSLIQVVEQNSAMLSRVDQELRK